MSERSIFFPSIVRGKLESNLHDISVAGSTTVDILIRIALFFIVRDLLLVIPAS